MGAKLSVLSLPKENSCGCVDRAALTFGFADQSSD